MTFDLGTQIFCWLVLFLVSLLFIVLAIAFRRAPLDPNEEQMSQAEFDRRMQELVKPIAEANKAMGKDKWQARMDGMEDDSD